MRTEAASALAAGAALALLAGCGEPERGAGGLPPEEARQLDDAAEMLDGPGAIDNSLFENDEEWTLPATEEDGEAPPDGQ